MLGVDHNPVLAPAPTQLGEAPALPAGALHAEAVPQAQKQQPMPMLRILMPVIMMVAVGAVMALMMLSGRAVGPMMLIFPLMMAFGLLAMFQPQEQQGDMDETRRVYLRHLDALTRRARTNAVQQREHFTYVHPEPALLLTGVPTYRVWERTAASPEALQVRLGTGNMALCTPVEVEDPGSPEDLDPVCAVSLRRAVAAVNTVAGMPIVVQLAAFPSVTLAGPRAREVARAIVSQLAFFHGPELVGLDLEHSGMRWAKWLPHTREPEQAEFRVAVLDAQAEPEGAGQRGHAASIAQTAQAADCVITVHPDADAFVDEHAFHVVCEDTLTAMTESGSEHLGTPDRFADEEAQIIARHLAFYRRPDDGTGARKTGGDLLAMLGYDDVQTLDMHTMWPGREGTRQRLTVPIGATPDGQAVYLDLKEAAHGGMGPHGLCIGATGSGKSEMLRSLVAALAATHSPDELNLVLVDFKGGATFLGCDALPHTSAVITNLEDEAVLVERMYDAISGEMNRRQELLRTAGNFANITDYTAARLRGEALDPLSALVIIVDEFSELLTQHPHFADLFVAVGRLGRSLGVHLLLASQRLDEGKLRGLDSHLSYRIGLKTFSSGESRQVLGVPDAYELPGEPGSGFLKAGSPDLVRFRASYVSGPLTRRVVEGASAEAPAVRLFEGWEPPALEAQTKVDTDATTTTLDAVVQRARELADAAGMRAHQVWLPPLPDALELHTVSGTGAERLRAPAGLIDDPYRQRQDPLMVDLSVSGGHIAIAGGPQTGKSSALRTIVAALCLHHTTEELAVYGIDAGSGGLDDLERLPHVAGVALRSDEERVRRVVDEVTGVIEVASASMRPARETILLIDGWHTLTAPDSKFEDLKEPLARIASEGPAAGVHLLVTTQRWNAIRPNVRDLIGTRYELHLTEPMDSLIDRKLQQKLPAKPGHGLTPGGKHMLLARANTQDLAHIAAQAADQTPVPRLKVLPAHVTTGALLNDATPTPPTIPLGIGGPHLAPVRCESGHVLAIGTGGSGKSTVIASAITAIEAMDREQARMVICDPRRTHLGRASDEMTAAYAASSTAIADATKALVTTMRSRLPGADVTPAQLAQRSWWSGPDIYLVIDDLELVGDEHLRDVVALLPHARDIGLHVVAARKFGGVSRALFGGFLGAMKDVHPDVLVMDGTRDEGALFGVKPTPQAPGRATLVQAGTTVGTVQLCAPYEEGEHL